MQNDPAQPVTPDAAGTTPPPSADTAPDNAAALARWRLVLGKFGERQLGSCTGGLDSRMEQALDFLYRREYAGRGVRQKDDQDGPGGASSEESMPYIPHWLGEVRDLFPQETAEVIQRHALERYGMTELVTDAEILKSLEPNYDLLKTILTFKDQMQGEVLEAARAIVRRVVDELKEKIAREVRQKLTGRINRNKPSQHKVARNLDFKKTIRANLKNYDTENRRIVIDKPLFSSRVERFNPWHIIIAVDCSGSMMDSVIYSAIMAGIFNSLPTMSVKLFAFDTAIVDLTGQVDNPVELLMSVQLGGGTDIHKALNYCEKITEQPSRTVVILVTDFCEGGSVNGMITSIKRMRSEGVRVLGLAALDSQAKPVYDRDTAQKCVDAGAEVAALTPSRLAQWISTVIH